MKNKAFTLIELLVVVLIIGILAAIALPQYRYAVEKAKYTALIPEMKALYNAIQIFILTNGRNPQSLADLDIEASDKIKDQSIETGKFYVHASIGNYQAKNSVWLTIMEKNNFKLNCETFVSNKHGVKLCKELGGVRHACPSEVWQGDGAIDCYDIPFQ
jgi:prepilin-type N-terminal cleavage/methylation domain-containing protein